MSYDASWDISGVKFDNATKKFLNSAKKATSNLKHHEAYLNKKFKENISTNMRRSGMDADNFQDVFELRISNHDITFVNTAPLITQRYEYGYYNGSNDTNEEYYEEYMIETSPRYFIRPAVQETLHDIGQIMLEDAKKEYMRQQ